MEFREVVPIQAASFAGKTVTGPLQLNYSAKVTGQQGARAKTEIGDSCPLRTSFCGERASCQIWPTREA